MVNAFEAGAQKVTIEVKLSSARILFVVADDGPGLPERLDLFKPFVTTKTNGTGLGLVHVKAFVDRNRGSIRVQSKPGSGTSFTLEFSKQYIMNEVL
jgi:signal transduction histidine kinase